MMRLLSRLRYHLAVFFAVIAGGIAFALLSLVPLAGIPIGLIGGAIALGAALGSRFGTRAEQQDFFAWGPRPAYRSASTAMTPPPAPPPTPTQTPPQPPGEGNT